MWLLAKGIFSDSNKNFYGMNQNIFPKVQYVDSNVTLQLMHDYVWVITTIAELSKVLHLRLFVNIALFHTWMISQNYFSLDPFGGVWILEESYKNIFKTQILKNVDSALNLTSVSINVPLIYFSQLDS